MAAYINFPDITGEVNESNHQGWVEVNSINLPIHRSIQPGAVGVARSNGETSLGDIAVHKTWDSSSPKLWARCGSGKFQSSVTIDLCSDIGGNTVVNLELVLTNCIVSSYSLSATGDQSPVPSEMITLNYDTISWNYTKYNQDGSAGPQFPASVNTETGAVTGD
jgi:type VI secretion system secreted protein Hcp